MIVLLILILLAILFPGFFRALIMLAVFAIGYVIANGP